MTHERVQAVPSMCTRQAFSVCLLNSDSMFWIKLEQAGVFNTSGKGICILEYVRVGNVPVGT